MTACAADGGLVQIGPIGGGNNPGDDSNGDGIDGSPGSPDAHPQQSPPDAHPQQSPPDASVSSPPDAASYPVCGSGVVDVGAPSTFVLNTPKLYSSSNFFVVRDSGGLYALSSRCTHEQAQCTTQSGHFYCPRHGAEFTYNGAIIGGPVNRPLVHYPMCMMSNGHVGVDTSTTTSSSDRLDV